MRVTYLRTFPDQTQATPQYSELQIQRILLACSRRFWISAAGGTAALKLKKGKGKFTLQQAIKAENGSRGIVLLFLQPRR
jgi:hypothetical protein